MKKNKPPHSHVICKKTGTIIDIESSFTIPDTLLPPGFIVEEKHVVVFGTFGTSQCKSHI